jgi:hypothetical protein
MSILASYDPYKVNVWNKTSADRCPAGHRLAIIRFKTKKDETKVDADRPAVVVAIPDNSLDLIVPENEHATFMLRSTFNDTQDTIIRSIVNDALNGSSMTTTADIFVDPDMLAVPFVLAYFYTGKNSTGRLDGETIEAWFGVHAADPLRDTIRAKVPSINAVTLEKHVSEYRNLAKKLAGQTVNLKEADAKNLRAVVMLADDNNVRAIMLRKLDKHLAELAKESDLSISIV